MKMIVTEVGSHPIILALLTLFKGLVSRAAVGLLLQAGGAAKSLYKVLLVMLPLVTTQRDA
jgi:hypothetical protein